MILVLFSILLIAFIARMIRFAINATWGIFKIVMYLVFLPLILIGLAFYGLMYIALPIMLVVGLLSALAKA